MTSMNWREMELFRHIDLEDSFILGWDHSDTFFSLTLEVSLWPGHKAYETPHENEHTCYKRGVLTFSNISKLVGVVPMENAAKSKDPDGSIDYGNLDSLSLGNDGHVHLCGAFGNVKLSSEYPVLEFEN